LAALGPASRRGAAPTFETLFTFGGAAVLVGLAVLGFFARSAALHCRGWGLITFIVIVGIGAVMNLIGLAASSSRPGAETGGLAATVIVLVLSGVFIAVLGKGAAAIPKFRASPVWAQEALVNAKL